MFDVENYKNIIEQIIPFHKVLGLELVSMKEGYASIRIPFKKELVGDPRTNRIHGGVISTAMDAAGGAAVITTLKGSSDQIATVDMLIDYLYPGRPEEIIVEGRITRNGSSLVFTEMAAHHPGDDQQIARARAVFRVKRNTNE
jgi:uncharacterized protein (TIGR00369 family)